MTKEVLIHIKTQQSLKDRSPEDGDDVIELIVGGEYYFRNGTHYLLYDETMEGFTESTQNFVKVRPDFMEVRKKGIVNVTMTFDKGKKNVTMYKTPFGMFEMEIETKHVRLAETKTSMDICADYVLGMNGSPVADCKMQMHITAKGDTQGMTFFQ